MEEQKIKQDIRIGANIRRIRKNRGIKPMALVRLLQLEGVEIPGRREPTPCAGGPAAFSARRLCGTRAWPERGSTASSSGGCPLLRRPWES